MAYYPKSQIKTNLFTNGTEYVALSTQKTYSGYYYEISSGEKYTGKFPGDGENLLLGELNIIVPPTDTSSDLNVPSSSNIISKDFNSNGESGIEILPRFIPQFIPTLPTNQDKQNGQFNRYFCKKNNELRYLEIDKDIHQKLQNKDPKIAWDLYTPVVVLWQIKGNKEQVYNSNKGTVISIEQNLSWVGFSKYLKEDFLKYYVGE